MQNLIFKQVLAAILIFLFAYTAVSKLLHLALFISTIEAVPTLRPFAGWVALGLPLVELVVCFLLALPRLRRKGFLLSFLLMFTFSVYIVLMLRFSTNLPCSCGGVIKLLTWKQHLLFNIFFLLLSAIGWYQPKPTTPVAQRPTHSNAWHTMHP